MNVRGRALMTLLLLAAALVALRAALPYWVASHLNQRMARMGDYRGHLAEVDLNLYRGAYQIKELRIEKRDGEVPAPLLQAPLIDLSVSWGAILDGALVGEVVFEEPVVNFVDSTDDQGEGQAGRGVDWRQQLEDLMPIRLNEVRVNDGVVAFRNPWTDPPVDLRMTDVQATIRNLTNVRDTQGRRDAVLDARGKVLGEADTEAHARFDPLGRLDDFDFDLRVTGIELTRLNTLARAYANLDVASGSGDFVMELDAAQGRLSGYAKPLLHDLEILDWEQDVERDDSNPLQVLWEAASDVVSRLFRNQPQDQFATRIPIEGDIGDAQTSTLGAIAGVLRNAFVEAYRARFENAARDDDERSSLASRDPLQSPQPAAVAEAFAAE